MPKQKWVCNVCSKEFDVKSHAIICEEAHAHTKQQLQEERKKTVKQHDTTEYDDTPSYSSRRSSSSKSDGNWRSNYPDAHGWHHSSTPG